MVRRLAITLALLGVASPAQAQWGLWPADSLLAAGRLAAAESAYFAASRAFPQDPVVRAALGKYLAARSATRVGAVLLEEARLFGGDSARIASALVPLYARARDYRALAALRPVVLSAADAARARWLSANPPQVRLPDSVAIVTYRALADGEGLGTVLLRIGRTELPAIIDPRVTGLHLPKRFQRDVRVFGTDGGRTIAVARSVRIGGATFSNVATTVASADEPVRLGFDVLAPLSPGFDPVAGLMTLRRAERRSRPPLGIRLPALVDVSGMRVLAAGVWQPTASSEMAMLLATRRWLWDERRGDVVLAP